MTRVDKIRNELINKILAISNKDFLEALDEIVSSSALVNEQVALSPE